MEKIGELKKRFYDDMTRGGGEEGKEGENDYPFDDGWKCSLMWLNIEFMIATM